MVQHSFVSDTYLQVKQPLKVFGAHFFVRAFSHCMVGEAYGLSGAAPSLESIMPVSDISKIIGKEVLDDDFYRVAMIKRKSGRKCLVA